MSTLDLRKNKPTVAPAAPAAPLPVANGFPLPEGKVLNLLPEERKLLDTVGWKEGDPIPNVAAALQAVQATMLTEPDYSGIAPLTAPKTVQYEDLPPDKQQEFIRTVKQMQEQGKLLDQLEKQSISDTKVPDLNEQIANMRAGTEQFQVRLDEPTPAQKKPDPVTEPETMTGLTVKSPCANCGFSGTLDDVTAVTDDDKFNFLTMLYGGSRFLKTYHLFNDTVQITFKSLTQKELDLTITQASCDARDGKIPDNAEYLRRVYNYEQVLALSKLVINGKPIVFPHSIDDIQVDEPESGSAWHTKVKTYYEYVMDTHITTSTLLKMLSMAYMRFTGLMGRLEGNMNNDSFWMGIVPPA